MLQIVSWGYIPNITVTTRPVIWIVTDYATICFGYFLDPSRVGYVGDISFEDVELVQHSMTNVDFIHSSQEQQEFDAQECNQE